MPGKNHFFEHKNSLEVGTAASNNRINARELINTQTRTVMRVRA